MRMELKSLRIRLLSLLSFILFPVAVIALANAYIGYEHYRTQLAASIIGQGEDVLGREEVIINRARNLLGAIAAMPPANAQQCNAEFRKLLLQYSDFSNIALLGTDGSVRCSGAENQGVIGELPFPRWFRDALKGRPFSVGTSAPSNTGTEPSLLAAAPLTDAAARVVGVLVVAIRLSAIEQVIRNFNLPQDAALIMLDRDGRALSQKINQTSAETWLPADFLNTAPDATRSGVFDAFGNDGIERRYVYLPLAGEIFAVFGMPLSSIGDPAYFLLFSNVGSVLLMWLTALITTALAVGYFVTRPLHRIRRGMAAYTTGDVRARIIDTEGLPAEIRQLASTFNNMADTIAARDEALRDAVAHQKALTREVHHRVRNNLQIINSLMNLQSWRAETPSEVATFSEVQRRVMALGIVHSAIYQGDDMRSVRLKALLSDLCAATEQAMADVEPIPLLETDSDELTASADVAAPLAFLLTEIIGEATARRNSTPRPSHIRIQLRKNGQGGILTVEADTPLFEARQGQAHPPHRSLNLLAGLVRQLGGRQHINDTGTAIQVTIPVISHDIRPGPSHPF